MNLIEFNINLRITDDMKDILRKPLWNNSEIKIGNQCIHYKEWNQKGITVIQDLINENGNFYTYEHFCQNYNIQCPFTLYFGLKNYIMKKWPKLGELEIKEIGPYRPKFIEILCKDARGSRTLYNILNKELQKKQGYELKWETSFGTTENIDWKLVNRNIFSSTLDSRLHWFQFRIVHRIIATNKFLNYIKVRNDPLCTFCKAETETIEHLFFHCHFVSSVWGNFESWIKEKTNIEISITLFDAIFLKYGKKFKALNLLIIIIKSYIYQKRLKDSTLNFEEVKQLLNYHFNLER